MAITAKESQRAELHKMIGSAEGARRFWGIFRVRPKVIRGAGIESSYGSKTSIFDLAVMA